MIGYPGKHNAFRWGATGERNLMDSRIRVCFENGNATSGKKIYEAHKICDCGFCQRRNVVNRGSKNRATATTKDERKIAEMLLFLEGWTCGSKTKNPRATYFNF